MAHEDWVQPHGLVWLLRAVDWLTLLLAAIGAALAIRLRGAGRALALFLLLFTLVNALHHVEARYAMPVRGLEVSLVALAALSLRLPRERRQEQRGQPDERAREISHGGQVRLGQPEHGSGGEH